MAEFSKCPTSPSGMSASGGGEYEEGEIVRLYKLKLLHMRYEGALVAVQEYVPSKGMWRVRLNTGEGIDMHASHMVKLDDTTAFYTGEPVRLKGLPIMQAIHEKQIAAIQEYVPQRDTWKLCLKNGEKIEVYSNYMKKMDVPHMHATGDLVRMMNSDHTAGEIVTVREYVSMKDAWNVTKSNGTALDVYSEFLKNVDPNFFQVGDLVSVEGETVAIQDYVTGKDAWKVRANDGSAFEIYREQVLRMDTPGSAFEGLARGGSGAATITDTFKTLFGKTTTPTLPGDKKSSSKFKLPVKNPFSKSSKTVEGKGGYNVGDQVHLANDGGKIALCKEFNSAKGKWKVVLNTGQKVECPASQLKPPIEPFGFKESQLVKLNGDGSVAAIQEVLHGKGMVCIRLPNGKPKYLFPDEFTIFKEDNEMGDQHQQQPQQQQQQQREETVQHVDPTRAVPTLREELEDLLTQAGTTLEEAKGFNDADIDELLKEEFKVPVVKRNKMKAILRQKEETVVETAVEAQPEPQEEEPPAEQQQPHDNHPLNFL